MQVKQNIQKGQKKKKNSKKQMLFVPGESLVASHAGVFRGGRAPLKLPTWEVSESAKEKCFQRDGRSILYIVI